MQDLFFWLDLVKWVVLLWIAYYYYNWAQEHLPFSPLLAMVVGAILVYYLVVAHPVLGAIGFFGWAIISSTLLLLIPSLFKFFAMKKVEKHG